MTEKELDDEGKTNLCDVRANVMKEKPNFMWANLTLWRTNWFNRGRYNCMKGKPKCMRSEPNCMMEQPNPPRPLASRRVDPPWSLQIYQRYRIDPNPTLPQTLAPAPERLGRPRPKTSQRFRIDCFRIGLPIFARKIVPKVTKHQQKSISEHGSLQTRVFDTILSPTTLKIWWCGTSKTWLSFLFAWKVV